MHVNPMPIALLCALLPFWVVRYEHADIRTMDLAQLTEVAERVITDVSAANKRYTSVLVPLMHLA